MSQEDEINDFRVLGQIRDDHNRGNLSSTDASDLLGTMGEGYPETRLFLESLVAKNDEYNQHQNLSMTDYLTPDWDSVPSGIKNVARGAMMGGINMTVGLAANSADTLSPLTFDETGTGKGMFEGGMMTTAPPLVMSRGDPPTTSFLESVGPGLTHMAGKVSSLLGGNPPQAPAGPPPASDPVSINDPVNAASKRAISMRGKEFGRATEAAMPLLTLPEQLFPGGTYPQATSEAIAENALPALMGVRQSAGNRMRGLTHAEQATSIAQRKAISSSAGRRLANNPSARFMWEAATAGTDGTARVFIQGGGASDNFGGDTMTPEFLAGTIIGAASSKFANRTSSLIETGRRVKDTLKTLGDQLNPEQPGFRTDIGPEQRARGEGIAQGVFDRLGSFRGGGMLEKFRMNFSLSERVGVTLTPAQLMADRLFTTLQHARESDGMRGVTLSRKLEEILSEQAGMSMEAWRKLVYKGTTPANHILIEDAFKAVTEAHMREYASRMESAIAARDAELDAVSGFDREGIQKEVWENRLEKMVSNALDPLDARKEAIFNETANDPSARVDSSFTELNLERQKMARRFQKIPADAREILDDWDAARREHGEGWRPSLEQYNHLDSTLKTGFNKSKESKDQTAAQAYRKLRNKLKDDYQLWLDDSNHDAAIELRGLQRDKLTLTRRLYTGFLRDGVKAVRNTSLATKSLEDVYKPGQKGGNNMDLMIEAAADDPQIMQMVYNWGLAEAVAKNVIAPGQPNAGGINARTLATWIKDRKFALDRVPELRVHLENVQAMELAAQQFSKEYKVAQTEWQKNVASRFFKDPMNYQEEANRMVNQPDDLAASNYQNMLSQSSDPDYRMGVKRIFQEAVYQRVLKTRDLTTLETGTEPFVNSEILKSMLDERPLLMLAIFDGDQGHIDNISKFAHLMELENNNRNLKGNLDATERGLLDDWQNHLRFLYNRIYGLRLKGFKAAGVARSVVESLDVKTSRQVLAEAFIDPNLFSMLMQKPTPASNQWLRSKIPLLLKVRGWNALHPSVMDDDREREEQTHYPPGEFERGEDAFTGGPPVGGGAGPGGAPADMFSPAGQFQRTGAQGAADPSNPTGGSAHAAHPNDRIAELMAAGVDPAIVQALYDADEETPFGYRGVAHNAAFGAEQSQAAEAALDELLKAATQDPGPSISPIGSPQAAAPDFSRIRNSGQVPDGRRGVP